MTVLEMPAFIQALPICPVRKVPVPWFVVWIDGKPEFRCADPAKLRRAITEARCWVCGERLNNRVTFVIGPMCAINRVSAEPPSHPDCARYSVRTCPFLSRPRMERRDGNLPQSNEPAAGVMIERNPGATCLWTTKSPGYRLERVPNGVLFRIINPTAVEWWAEGRAATREEVMESVRTGLPLLREMADVDGPDAHVLLEQMTADAQQYFDLAAAT